MALAPVDFLNDWFAANICFIFGAINLLLNNENLSKEVRSKFVKGEL